MIRLKKSKIIDIAFFGLPMALVMFAIVFVINSASAAFTPQINYQGKLTDASDNAVTDGNYNFRFRLCTASLAGACSGSVVYDETFTGSDRIAITSGLFSAMIGSVSSTLDTVDFNQALYLEVRVGGSAVTPVWETLSPVKILGAVPNAFNTLKFDGLATTSFLRADLSNASAIITNATFTNATTTNAYISGNLFNGILNGLAEWNNGLASVTTTPTMSGLTVSGASSLGTLAVSSNATTSGYLTVGTAFSGANFSAGNLNVQYNGVFGGYVSSTGNLHTSANLTVQGTSVFTGLISGTGFENAFDARVTSTWRALPNGLASLGADGKVPITQLSPIAITDTFVTSSEAGMLALNAQVGDVAIRLDLSKSYILRVADPTVLANWSELIFPTDAVRSVNTKTGDVTLSTDDINIGLTNFYYTEARYTSSTNAIKAQPNGLASLGADGTIPAAQIGSMFLNDTFVFAATSSLLTSGATKGDIGISTDQSKTYVLKTTDPTVWANWAEILNSSAVVSVNGFTGAITLTTSNITEGTNQYWTQGRFDTALTAATTWSGDLFVDTGNVGIGIAAPTNALEVIGNASTSNNMYVGNDLYVGYSNGTGVSDKIYFSEGNQSLIWSIVNNRFELSDGLYVTNNIIASGSVSSTALQVTGNATTTGALSVGTLLGVNGEYFSDLTGTNLYNSSGVLMVTSSPTFSGDLTVGNLISSGYVSSTALQINGNATTTGAFYIGGTLSVGTTTMTNLIVTNVTTSTFAGGLTVGTSQFVVQQSTGNVGIGTTSPEAKLHVLSGDAGIAPSVNADDFVIENTGAYVGMSLLTSDDQRSIIYWGSPSDNVGAYAQWVYNDSLFQIGSAKTGGEVSIRGGNAVEAIRVNSSGNVGIGTSTPDSLLQVGNATSYFKINSGNATTTGYLTIGLAPAGALFTAGNFNVQNAVVIGTTLSAGTSTLTNLIVTNNTTSTFSGGLTVGVTDLVVQQSTGFVGFGAASPVNNVTIDGTGMTLENNNPIYWNGYYSGGFKYWKSTSSAYINQETNGDIVVKTAPAGIAGNTPTWTTRFIIQNTTGNIGIGTSTPDSLFQVGNATSFFKVDSGNATTTGYLTVGSAPTGINYTTGSLNMSGSILIGNNLTSIANYGGLISKVNSNVTGYGIYVSSTNFDGGNHPDNYAVYGVAQGGGAAYGIYGTAAGASTNWAGYFNAGNVYVANNLGIGDASPDYALSIGTAGKFTVDASGNSTTTGTAVFGTGSGDSVINFSDAGVTRWVMGNDASFDQFTIGTSTLGTNNVLAISNTTGNVQIGKGTGVASTTSKFSVYISTSIWGGVNNTTGAWQQSSDLNLKTNITDLSLESPLQKLLGLRPVRYDWKSDDINGSGQHIGFIAQEVEALFPELVSTGGNGLKSLSYAEFSPIITAAVQEQQQEINLLKAQLSTTTPVTAPDSSSQQHVLAVTDQNPYLNTLRVAGSSTFDGKLTVKGAIYLNQDTIGQAKILANSTTTIAIKFSGQYQYLPIVNISPLGTEILNSNIKYTVATVSSTGFTIQISELFDRDLTFMWHAFMSSEETKLFVSDGTDSKMNITVSAPVVADDPMATASPAEPIPVPVIVPVPEAEVTSTVSTTEPVIAPAVTEPVVAEPPVEPVVETAPAEPPAEISVIN